MYQGMHKPVKFITGNTQGIIQKEYGVFCYAGISMYSAILHWFLHKFIKIIFILQGFSYLNYYLLSKIKICCKNFKHHALTAIKG